MEARDKPYYISNRLREFAFVGGRTGVMSDCYHLCFLLISDDIPAAASSSRFGGPRFIINFLRNQTQPQKISTTTENEFPFCYHKLSFLRWWLHSQLTGYGQSLWL